MLFFVSFVAGIAAETGIYVNNTYVRREFTTIGGFDMVPILDIAGELGFTCTCDGQHFQLSNGETTYSFMVGSADVYAQDGTWFGLDIVPTVVDGRIMIPSNFLIYNLGVSYTWDDITSTLFINSDYSYQWLINTWEYKAANPKYMAGRYVNMLRSKGVITSAPGKLHGGYYQNYDVNQLWYFMDDVNYDGILDLVVSVEQSSGNGILIYSFYRGYPYILSAPGMPYSSGTEILTLATYKGTYGILRHRQNSADEFEFSKIDVNGNKKTEIYGWHNSAWTINNTNVGKSKWASIYNAVNPVSFYNIWELSRLAY